MSVPPASTFDPNDDEQVRSLAAAARLATDDLVVINPVTHVIDVIEHVTIDIYPDLATAIQKEALEVGATLILVHLAEPIVRINITKE